MREYYNYSNDSSRNKAPVTCQQVLVEILDLTRNRPPSHHLSDLSSYLSLQLVLPEYRW